MEDIRGNWLLNTKTKLPLGLSGITKASGGIGAALAKTNTDSQTCKDRTGLLEGSNHLIRAETHGRIQQIGA